MACSIVRTPTLPRLPGPACLPSLPPGGQFQAGDLWGPLFLCLSLKCQRAQGYPIRAPCSPRTSAPPAPQARLYPTLGWPAAPRLHMTKADPITLSPESTSLPLSHLRCSPQQASCLVVHARNLGSILNSLSPFLSHLSNNHILILLPPNDVLGVPPLSPDSSLYPLSGSLPFPPSRLSSFQ